MAYASQLRSLHPVKFTPPRFLFAALLLARGLTLGGAAAPAQPNILLFFADDWGRDAGCYADPARPSPSDVVKTPEIDRMAREGVRFTNAFYSCPQCSPSRGAVVSGCYFWRCGSAAFLNGGEWRSQLNPFLALPRFPHLLAEAGYATAKAFKTLQFTPTLKEAPEDYLRYSLHVSRGATAADRASRREAIIAQTRRSIRRVLDGRRTDQPFFFIFGPINTHRPYATGSGQALWGIDPATLQGRLPAYLPDVPEVRTDMADYLGEVQALDLMVGLFREELEKSGQLDRTLIVLTGDNGTPGFPHGKTQLYDLGSHAPLVVRWPGHIKAGRTVDDFVNLMDLGPTFLEVAGVARAPAMDGRSMLPQLLATASGTIDPQRDHAIFGRERHYGDARAGNLPYPSRAIRTADYLYIRNFKPDRWPWGDPTGITSDTEGPTFEAVSDYERLAAAPFRDMDGSLTKGWIVAHRADAGKEFYAATFGKRPAEELYDLRRDPDQIHNLAAEAAQAETRQQLADRLMNVLRATHDPRLDDTFDHPPYVETNPGPRAPRKRQIEKRAKQ